MGWTFINDHRPRSADAYFREQFGERYTVLGSATCNLFEYYAAVRDNTTGEVSCFVAMIRFERDRFGYKDMEERMGPGIASCPGRILDLLPPLPECDHEEEYCRWCGSEITGPADGRWVSEARPGQVAEVAGPHCYSGHPASAKRDDGPPFHEPGGTAPCGTCWARDWRRRCRETIAVRKQQLRLLTDEAVVRLVGAERYVLPADVAANPVFTVVRSGRKLKFRHGGRDFRFARDARWERAS